MLVLRQSCRVNGKIRRIAKVGEVKARTHHFTACACLSRATLTVAHEKRTIEGYPNVGSTASLNHACVFGSVFRRRQQVK